MLCEHKFQLPIELLIPCTRDAGVTKLACFSPVNLSVVSLSYGAPANAPKMSKAEKDLLPPLQLYRYNEPLSTWRTSHMPSGKLNFTKSLNKNSCFKGIGQDWMFLALFSFSGSHSLHQRNAK